MPRTVKTVADWLDVQDRADLVDLVQVAASMSESFANHLALVFARSGTDLTDLETEIDVQLRTDGFLHWRESSEFANEVAPVVAALTEVVDDGRAAEAVPLIQRAIGRLTKVMGHADDSSGLIGDLVRRLLDLHARACRTAPPEAPKLVRWLVRYGLDDQDGLTVDVDDYAEALGPVGLAAYSTEIDRRLAAGDDSFELKRARQRIAIAGGDVDAVVRLLGEDLTETYQFLRVAEAMREMARYDDLLDFALRGIEGRADWQARKLYDLATHEYERRRDRRAALELRRRELDVFRDSSALGHLRTAARALGVWDVERAPALAQLEDNPRDHVIALLDDDPEAAWTAASAAPDAIDGELWRRLAGTRETSHPVEVLPVYRAIVDGTLQTTGRQSYLTAIKDLKRLHKAAQAAGEPHDAEFSAYVDELRELNRRRPTFITLLDSAGLSRPR